MYKVDVDFSHRDCIVQGVGVLDVKSESVNKII